MIIGTGIDLVEISRIEDVLSKRSDRFIRHVLHEAELPAFEESRRKGSMLAKRFAVKEAATKALGTGQAQNVLLRHFYVLHNELGKPELHADDEAKIQCEKLGVNAMHVSISDEGGFAIAQVILERV